MDSGIKSPPKKRRWSFWAVVILNAAGLLLIIPLLRITIPLVNIWWRTHSQENWKAHEQTVHPASSVQVAEPRMPEHVAEPQAALERLTNQLSVVDKLSDQDLGQIVASNFGPKSTNSTRATGFDMDSAVFDSISKATLTNAGRVFYAYQIDLVDDRGNHKTNIEYFAEPNLDYERSLATMDLINRSPQLKRIYQAMAAGLAERTRPDPSTSTNTKVTLPAGRKESAEGTNSVDQPK